MADGREREGAGTGADPSSARAREILERRARAVAAARAAEAPEGIEVLAFEIAGERYALELSEVIQVLDARALAPLPGAPAWLLGAAVARSGVVPVLDLRQRLGLASAGIADANHVVVVEHDGDPFGVAVERLAGRLHLPREGLAPGTGPVRFVTADRLALLDLAAVHRGQVAEAARG